VSDAFDFAIVFTRMAPWDMIFKGDVELKETAKAVKEYISDKIEIYTERMQKNIHLAIRKRIGECEEPKVFYNIYKHLTKIIAVPAAEIFIGKVSVVEKFFFFFFFFFFF